MEGEDERLREMFRLSELLDPMVLRPFLVSLSLMVLGQLSGQASLTFYTAHIFQVLGGAGVHPLARNPRLSQILRGRTTKITSPRDKVFPETP